MCKLCRYDQLIILAIWLYLIMYTSDRITQCLTWNMWPLTPTCSWVSSFIEVRDFSTTWPADDWLNSLYSCACIVRDIMDINTYVHWKDGPKVIADVTVSGPLSVCTVHNSNAVQLKTVCNSVGLTPRITEEPQILYFGTKNFEQFWFQSVEASIPKLKVPPDLKPK